VDECGDFVSDVTSSNYSFDSIVDNLSSKFIGVIRQNKIDKLLNG
jgi:hypothetical protein